MNDPASDISKSQPFSDEAEKGVLSCILSNPHMLDDFTESEDAFYHPSHRCVYLNLIEMQAKGRPIELLSVTNWILDKGDMDKIGGNAAIAELYSFYPTPAHFPFYCGILRDKLLLRKIIAACSNGIALAYEHQENVSELLDNVEQSIFAIRPQDAGQKQGDHIKTSINATVDLIESRILNQNNPLTGYSTGLHWLDANTGGMRPETWFIGARPSVGKTALALQVIVELGIEQSVPLGFFSLEMSAQRVHMRLISILSEVPLEAIRAGKMDRDEQTRMMAAVVKLQKSTILIDDRPGLTLAQVRAKARRWKRAYGIKAVFGDYIQRMGSDSKRKSASERDGHAENVTGITNMGKELDVCNFWLAQLNRDCDGRPSGRPRMSDFEGCGRIEQDADLALLLSRPNDQPDDPRTQHILFDIVKQRDGDTRDRLHTFHRETASFGKYPPKVEERPAESEPAKPARKPYKT